MNDTDFTTALSRLLTDPLLRDAFDRDRSSVAARLGVRNRDRYAFLALDADAVEEQAAGLLDKRFHEVARLLPETTARLGERAEDVFREFAVGFWPKGHRRHVVDAVEFCRFLEATRKTSVCRAERNWWRFAIGRRKWAVHFVRDLVVNRELRTAIQVLIRRKHGQGRQFCIYVKS